MAVTDQDRQARWRCPVCGVRNHPRNTVCMGDCLAEGRKTPRSGNISQLSSVNGRSGERRGDFWLTPGVAAFIVVVFAVTTIAVCVVNGWRP